MKNLLIEISYDGTNFCGWQKQPGKRSVSQEIENAVSELLHEDINIIGAGRTDAKVHAKGQKANFVSNFNIPLEKFIDVANKRLPSDVKILNVKEVHQDFHARYDAKRKKYTYRIINCISDKDEVFNNNYCYYIKKNLDLANMGKALNFFEGTHDFKGFMSAGSSNKGDTVRTIYSAKLIVGSEKTNGTNDIEIEFVGSGFLYNMVRIIVGTVVDVGLGKRNSENIQNIINSKDRKSSGPTAPPQGLYLTEVYYD